MSQPKTIQIDNVQYVRADSVSVAATRKQIVVLQRGWIVVGDVEKTPEEVKISNCSVIRNWGTTKGLGEIAEDGPTAKTVLDKCPDVMVHPLTVVMLMNINESKW